ncbi:MAG: PEGA domain-containing protein [Gemmatimonadales bacterium]
MISTRWIKLIALVLAVGVAGAACATLMQGTSQELSIGSSPTGARVIVDGSEAGKTPFVASLKRKDKHVVRLEMDGYKPYELALSRGTSGWVWGNLVFGGLPGLAIDAITGGLYKLKPEQVQATLESATTAYQDGGDMIVVAVVLHPDPEWQRVGQLSREN